MIPRMLSFRFGARAALTGEIGAMAMAFLLARSLAERRRVVWFKHLAPSCGRFLSKYLNRKTTRKYMILVEFFDFDI